MSNGLELGNIYTVNDGNSAVVLRIQGDTARLAKLVHLEINSHCLPVLVPIESRHLSELGIKQEKSIHPDYLRLGVILGFVS